MAISTYEAKQIDNSNAAMQRAQAGTVLQTLEANTAGVTASMVGVQKFTQTVAKTAFTDGLGATGTYKLTAGSIPAKAIVLFAAVTAITGFAGDTSATIQIGDGTDVDRYSTGTPSVFTTASNGIAVGLPSGVQYHDAAKDVTLTVTTASDFTSLSAGSVTVSIYYIL